MTKKNKEILTFEEPTKEQWLSIRISEYQLKIIEKAAMNDGLPKSMWARRMLVKLAERSNR